MTCFKFTAFLLFLLLISQVCSEEPEITIRKEGKSIVLGYCFGADYIAVYKSTPGGYQLIGNSSDTNLTNTLPADLQRRINVNYDKDLLGILINSLGKLDSGTYKRECWKNQKLISKHTEQLTVCKEETASEEISVNKDGGAEILCKSPSIGLEGTSVRWYQETHPAYKSVLLLDTSVSLEPQIEKMQGVVEAKENGALLVLDKTVVDLFPQFYCAVIKGETCLDFQNIYLVDKVESWDIFVSQGDRVVLNCPADGNQQKWETPLGEINSSSMKNNQMYISAGDEPENFSLIIPVVSDEHSGRYSCTSPLAEIQYVLSLCPKSKTLEKVAYARNSISLECNYGQENNKTVQWHRRTQSDQYKLIAVIEKYGIISEDPKGKMTLSDSGLLTISDLNMNDTGTYRCTVLTQPEFLESDNYEGYYGENVTEYDADDYGEHFETVKCVFQQKISVTVVERTRGLNVGKVTPSDVPPEDSNHMWYAVGGGLVVLVAVVVAAILIVKKRKDRKTSCKENSDNNERFLNNDTESHTVHL